MTDNKKKSAGKSYYMLASTPMFYDKPLIPNMDYDLTNADFVKGMYIKWHFVAFRLLSKGGLTVRLGLDKGEFLNLPLPDISTKHSDQADVDDKLKLLRSKIGRYENRKLHRSSCIVKTKISSYGVGMFEPIVGWYNSSQHTGLSVLDVAPILVAESFRYTADSTSRLISGVPAFYANLVDGSGKGSFTDSYTWRDHQGNEVKMPYFLHLGLIDYLCNRTRLQEDESITLPSEEELLKGPRASTFRWNAEVCVGSDISSKMSASKKYLVSPSAVTDIMYDCDWVRLNHPRELDNYGLALVAKNFAVAENFIP